MYFIYFGIACFSEVHYRFEPYECISGLLFRKCLFFQDQDIPVFQPDCISLLVSDFAYKICSGFIWACKFPFLTTVMENEMKLSIICGYCIFDCHWPCKLRYRDGSICKGLIINILENAFILVAAYIICYPVSVVMACYSGIVSPVFVFILRETFCFIWYQQFSQILYRMSKNSDCSRICILIAVNTKTFLKVMRLGIRKDFDIFICYK